MDGMVYKLGDSHRGRWWVGDLGRRNWHWAVELLCELRGLGGCLLI
jgi:hypothetical protein